MKNARSLVHNGLLLFPLALLVAGATTIGCAAENDEVADDEANVGTDEAEYRRRGRWRDRGAPAPAPTTAPTPAPTTTAPPAPTTPAPAPGGTVPAGLMGYAAMNGGTTGGAGGATVTVTSCSQLVSAAQGNTPKIIKVSGVLTGNDTLVNVGSNKSIIGLPGAEIRACGLYMFGSSNVIIQNLKLVDGNTYSTWTAKEGAHNIWIDHVEMRGNGGDNGHTMAAVQGASDFVTISWSSFHDKYTGLLIGGATTTTSDKGHLTVTLHHCLFDNMLERQPKVRFATIHAFNNYFRNAMTDGHTPFGITVTMGGIVRTDANYFQNFKGYPISTRYDSANETDGFISGLETNYKDSAGSYQITTAASSWKPPYAYASYLTPVADVPATVLKGVGPTL